MPFTGGVFQRIWRFVDQFSTNDTVDRADLDIAFDDLVAGLNSLSGSTTLSSSVISVSENYAITTDNAGNLIRVTSDAILMLPAAADGGDGLFVGVVADGATVTVNPNGSEKVSGLSSVTVKDTGSCILHCDGTRWHLISDNSFGRANARNFASRAEMLALWALHVDSGITVPVGTKWTTDGWSLEYDGTTTTVPGMSGWKPFGKIVYPEQFGAPADGATSDVSAMQAALTYLTAIGGGILHGREGSTYLVDETVFVRGDDITLASAAPISTFQIRILPRSS